MLDLVHLLKTRRQMYFRQLGIVALLASGLSLVAARAASGGLLSRSAIDVCGNVSDELILPGLFGKKTNFGHISEVPIFLHRLMVMLTIIYVDKCICQSQIPILLKTDPLFITVGVHMYRRLKNVR